MGGRRVTLGLGKKKARGPLGDDGKEMSGCNAQAGKSESGKIKRNNKSVEGQEANQKRT